MNTVIAKLWPIYCAYLFSQFGNWAFRAGFVYAVYDQQNGSNSVLGWTIVIVYVPILLGGRFISPLADRFNSRKMLILIDLSRVVLLIPMLFITSFDSTQGVVFGLIVVALLSLFTPVFSSAQSVYIRKKVEEEQLTSSLAIISNLDWFSTLVGTICGPLLLMYFAFRNIVIIDMLTFIVAIVLFICFLDRNEEHNRLVGNKNDKEQIQSVDEVDHKNHMKLAILAIFFLNLGAGVINLYPNVIARNIYSVGEVGLSYIYIANGIAGFIGALLIAQFRKRFKLIHIVTFSSILIGLSLMGMSLMTNFTVSIVTSSLMLLFGQLFGVGIHSYLLKNVPAHQAGRMTGMFMYATFSGVALNAILFATLLSQAAKHMITIFILFCAGSAGISAILLLVCVSSLSKRIYKEKADLNV